MFIASSPDVLQMLYYLNYFARNSLAPFRVSLDLQCRQRVYKCLRVYLSSPYCTNVTVILMFVDLQNIKWLAIRNDALDKN